MPPIPASNRLHVEAYRPAVSIDPTDPYAPSTMTYHGFSIQVGGVHIGRITEWTPQELDRNVETVKELNPRTFGQPVDVVPGVATNFTVSFTRAEVWNEEIEKAFGAAEDVYSLLVHQNRPFAVDEVFTRGLQLYRLYRYVACWFSRKSFTAFTADGNGIVECQGELTFGNRIRLL